MTKTLVFTLALNGYQWVYRSLIATQRQYALRHGMTYVAVTRPHWTRLGVECCWLKLLLMKEALEEFDTVVFIDADARCQLWAPDIRNLQIQGKYLYLARGRSGIYNSGVMMAVKHRNSIDFLERVLAAKSSPVAESQIVGWGENAHVAHFASASPIVSELPLSWNNTSAPALHDYIRHYNHGPLRPARHIQWFHRLLARSSRLYNRWVDQQPLTECSLRTLFNQAVQHYPIFTGAATEVCKAKCKWSLAK